MKTNFFSLGVLVALGLTGLNARAELAPSTEVAIRSHRFGACSFWSNLRTEHGSGYVCSGYPMSVEAADAWDTQREIDALKARIQRLEAALTELQSDRDR